MSRTLSIVGVNFHTAPPELMDAVVFADPERFCGEVARRGIRQRLILATCNRREVVFMADSEEEVEQVRRLFVASFPQAARLDEALEVRTGDAALTYLFRIAAGLESMILGEYQILGQVKEAHTAALRAECVGKELDRILRDAITCAKRVKTELDIGAVPPSVCRAGMELAERRFGIAGKRVFVIGSGKTGKLAAHFAKERGARSLAVCNRSPERAKALERTCGARVVDYAERYAVIAESDLVVSATASPHVVVCADRLSLSHPVAFLDLASPRDIEPAVADNPLVSLVGIDTIGELAAGDRAERERLTALGMGIVHGAVTETATWLAGCRP